MTRTAIDVGDKVQWPNTQMAAAEASERSLTVEDRIDTRYKSGSWYFRYLYADLADRMIEDMHSNISDDYDNVILVVGGEGTGKSHLSYYIAKHFDADLDLKESLVYSWDKFLTSVLSDNPQKVYWFDEAAMVASNREWNKDENVMLYKALQVVRSLGLVIIFNIPSIRAVDNYIREFRTRYLLKAHKMCWNNDRESKRGYAELLLPKSEEERRMMKKDAKPDELYRSVGFFRFSEMKGADREIYDKLKLDSQKESLAQMLRIMEEKKEGSSRYKRDKQSLESLVSYMADVQGLSYNEIAEIAGMPYNTVKTMAWRRRQKGDDDGIAW